MGGAGRSRVEMDEGGEVGVGGWVEGGSSVNVSTTVWMKEVGGAR